jgi:hypothetical protein
MSRTRRHIPEAAQTRAHTRQIVDVLLHTREHGGSDVELAFRSTLAAGAYLQAHRPRTSAPAPRGKEGEFYAGADIGARLPRCGPAPANNKSTTSNSQLTEVEPTCFILR